MSNSPFIISINVQHGKTRFTIQRRGSDQRDTPPSIDGTRNEMEDLRWDLERYLDATAGLEMLEKGTDQSR